MIRRETKQKEQVYAVFNKIYHPTVEQVIERLEKSGEKVARATVFRTLNVLAEENKISKLMLVGSPMRYDGNVKAHAHFVCENCGEIFDLESSSVADHKIETEHLIKSKSVIYYGLCKNCAQGEKNEKI